MALNLKLLDGSQAALKPLQSSLQVLAALNDVDFFGEEGEASFLCTILMKSETLSQLPFDVGADLPNQMRQDGCSDDIGDALRGYVVISSHSSYNAQLFFVGILPKQLSQIFAFEVLETSRHKEAQSFVDFVGMVIYGLVPAGQ